MRKLLLLIPALGLSGFLNAQSISPEVKATAGDQNTVGTTSISWTIGETLVETATGSSSTVTQGFHQPSYVLVALEQPLNQALEIDVFPNPTQERVYLEFERDQESELSVRLLNLNGQILQEKTSLELTERLEFDMSNLPDGQYFLEVQTPAGQFKAYKVQKIN